MEEEQKHFETIEIGTKEPVKLKPATVKVLRPVVESIEKGKVVACYCKHPETEKEVRISSAKIESNGKLVVVGLWFNQDDEGKIRKNSGLASFLTFMKVGIVKALEGKECLTVEDENGYLVFKAY